MAGPVTVGLDFVVGRNAPITFVFFVAMALLSVLGARFGYYAYQNGTRTRRVAQRPVWWGLTGAGAAAAAFALLGILEVTTSIGTSFRRGILLAHVCFLSFVVQRLCRELVPLEDDETWTVALDEGFWVAGAGVAALVTLGAALAADHPVVLLLEGAGAATFAAVGLVTGREGLAVSRVRGTVVDTLLRHLLPVLVFAAAILLLELGVPVVGRAVVVHVQVVFVITTATALMTATIKLRQNLATL